MSLSLCFVLSSPLFFFSFPFVFCSFGLKRAKRTKRSNRTKAPKRTKSTQDQIPQLDSIPLIYYLLEDYMPPTTFYGNQEAKGITKKQLPDYIFTTWVNLTSKWGLVGWKIWLHWWSMFIWISTLVGCFCRGSSWGSACGNLKSPSSPLRAFQKSTPFVVRPSFLLGSKKPIKKSRFKLFVNSGWF